MNTTTKQTLAVIGLLVVTAIWGSTFILVKWTIAAIDLYYFLFLRFVIASVLMGVIFFNRLRGISMETIGAGVVLGLLLTVAYISQTEGLQYTSASNSAMITGLYMVLIPFCMLIYPGRRPPLVSVLGIVVAIPGLCLLTQYSLTGVNVGDVITFITAMSCAWHIILTGEFTKRHPLVPLVIVQFVCAALICGVVLLFRGGGFSPVPPIGWFTLVITAIFATCFAFMVQAAAQRVIDSTRTGIIFAMEAVFGALFGWWLGGETMMPMAFAGACLMVLGMIISEIHPLARGLIDKLAG